MREFETTFAKGLKKGLREDDENPRNEEALVECLNTKPSEEGPIPIVPITTPMDVTMAWPFPQVFDRPVAAAICDGVTTIGYSGDDPIAPEASSTTNVTITNGLPPFTWAVTGTGLSWTYATTRGRTNILIASSSATSDGSWTATDRCDEEAGGDICVCTTGFATGSNAATIVREDDITITVVNGCASFTWAVAGTGFSFASATTTGRTNTLTASASACGTATITVTDGCDDTVTIYVRCTTGEWVLKGAVCGLTAEGEATETACGGSGDRCYEYISGYQKQTHQYDYKTNENYRTCAEIEQGCIDTYCGDPPGIECEPCLDWDADYGVHRVPCYDRPTDLLPDRSTCGININFAYYEWECA